MAKKMGKDAAEYLDSVIKLVTEAIAAGNDMMVVTVDGDGVGRYSAATEDAALMPVAAVDFVLNNESEEDAKRMVGAISKVVAAKAQDDAMKAAMR